MLAVTVVVVAVNIISHGKRETLLGGKLFPNETSESEWI